MPAPRVLFVKLSSLGDVIHHLPAVTDLAEHRPDARIAWAVEEAYAPLVRLHPAVEEVVPVGLRSLRGNPLERSRWSRLAEARRALARGGWDYVIDSQGLLKSALVARAASGIRFGMDRKSSRERIAARFYDVRLPVARSCGVPPGSTHARPPSARRCPSAIQRSSGQPFSGRLAACSSTT